MKFETDPMEAVKAYCCVLCSKRTKPNDRRKLHGANNENIRKYLYKTFCISVNESHVLCNKCRQLYYTDDRKRLLENKIESRILDLIKSIRDIALRNAQTRIDFDNPQGLQKHEYRNLT
ncbi:hypothetical protein KUTeg_011671, partial [Tegillarca granosa]